MHSEYPAAPASERPDPSADALIDASQTTAPGTAPAAMPVIEGDSSTGNTSAVPHPASATATTADAAPKRRRRAAPAVPTWTPRQRVALALDARHDPNEGICAACPTESGKPLPRSTLAAWRRSAGWADAVRQIQAGMVVECDARSRALRLDAMEVLGRATRGEIECDPNERVSAAGKLLVSTQPVGAERAASAIRDFIASMPSWLRLAVEGWQNGDESFVGLTVDELRKRGGL